MTGEEKAFLKKLACKYYAVIECKKTDAISVSKKRETWMEITTEFNSNSEHSNVSVYYLFYRIYTNITSLYRISYKISYF